MPSKFFRQNFGQEPEPLVSTIDLERFKKTQHFNIYLDRERIKPDKNETKMLYLRRELNFVFRHLCRVLHTQTKEVCGHLDT